MENEYYKRYEPFFGEWRIKRFIGAGSYGRVFEIERRDEFDTVYTGALKAVTIPSSQGELDEILADGMDMNGASTYFRDYVKELNREIALMSKLKGHSNIVSYEDHAIHAHEDGIGWDILIRMELLTPITSYLKQNHTFTRREVIQLGMDLCKALEICQRYNIIHRDIKPANIFISETEDFKLGDFGVARIASASTGASTRAGTVNYMAPEVFRGEKYTSNVDIYSLGLVMYQLLNNNRMPLYPPYPQPITPSSRERAQAQRLSGAALPPPANAEGRLAEIVLKACAPDPAQRYDSPTVMRQALEAILYTEGEAKMIYPEGDTVPVPSTSGAAAPEENDPNGETERPVWGKAHADSEKPAKAEKDLPECLKNARDDAPLEQQFSLRELSGLSKEEADALDLTLKPMPQPAPAAEPAAPAVPQEPAADQTVRVETAQPAAPADDRTVRLMPADVQPTPAPAPKEDHTERVAAPAPQVPEMQDPDKTTVLFAAQAEQRRKQEQARRDAEEAARRAAEAEKEQACRAAEQAEAARKAAEAAAEKPAPEAKISRRKMLGILGGAAVVAVGVGVGGVAMLNKGKAAPAASSSSEAAIIASGKCGDGISWSLDENGVLWLSGEGKMDDYESADVSPWAKKRGRIVEVNFENGITTVGGYAFRNCSRLQKVTLPSSLQSIKQSAFNHCAELTSIEIPEGTETIDGFAFTGCEVLADVTIPESMKTIKRYAFRGCNKLRKVKTNSDCILGTHAFPDYVSISYY